MTCGLEHEQPLRIALVSELLPELIGGLVNHVISLAEAFEAAGHSVTLVGRKGNPRGVVPLHLAYRGILPQGERGWKEREVGTVIMDRRRLNGLRIKRVLRALQEDHDIVHYHGHNIASVPADMPRVFYTAHDYAGICPRKTLFDGVTQCSNANAQACGPCYLGRDIGKTRARFSAWEVSRWRATARMVAARHSTLFVSEGQRRLWGLYGVASSEDSVVRNFYAAKSTCISDEETRERYHVAADGALVVVASSQLPYKGVEPFVRELAKINQEVAIVVAGGDGDDVAGRVQRTGWLPRDDVLSLMRAADVFVVPSVWPEPCPTTALEAVHCGTRVAGLRVGGLVELAEDSGGWIELAPSMPELASLVSRMARECHHPAPAPEALFSRNSPAEVLARYRRVLHDSTREVRDEG